MCMFIVGAYVNVEDADMDVTRDRLVARPSVQDTHVFTTANRP